MVSGILSLFPTRSHSKKICQPAKSIFLERVGSGGGGLGFSYQEIRSLGTKGGRVMLQVVAEEYFGARFFREREK